MVARILMLAGLLALCLASAPWARPDESRPGRICSEGAPGPTQCIRIRHEAFDICETIYQSARHHALDPGFFARLLWQESRFDRHALSPANAMGIAQFIRSTADLRGLKDPYNPAEAILHSAAYLGELSRRFGNVGLAAVAYNGGEWRLESFLKGGPLKRETINYVRIITGLTAETWRDKPPDALDLSLDKDLSFLPACRALAAGRKKSPLRLAPLLPPWGVQLAHGRSEAEARRRYKSRTRICKRALRGERPDVILVPNRVRGRPSFFMARIGRSSRRAADRLCAEARKLGCTCAVYRNF